MLLPFKDYVGGAVAYKIYEEVEHYLKESSWCFYKSNSAILDILGNYKNQLETHLANSDVLKVIADKTRSGSLIRVVLDKVAGGVKISLEIKGANGEDILFKRSTRVSGDEVTIISQAVKNWLAEYEDRIPYDGIIVGVLGNQFTVDVGKMYGILAEDEVLITRLMKKKNHPLLKEIVDWDTEKIASGRIIHSSKNQSQGKVFQYDTPKKIAVGDWIVKRKSVFSKQKAPSVTFDNPKDYEFGKLGYVQLLFNIGSGSASNTTDGENSRKLGGTVLGVDANVEIWGTRNIFGRIGLSKKFGSYSKKEGSFVNNSNSLSESSISAVAGYRYLPLGFFYGPQIDGYLGYGSKTYSFDSQTSDGLTEFNFKGIVLGTKGSIPLIKDFRAFLDFNFIFNPQYTEEARIYGEDDSSSFYSISLGSSYNYTPSITIDGMFTLNSAKASFEGPERSIKIKDSSLRFGASYSF